MWTGDALHGPVLASRQTYLFAFLDDHSRLLTGYRRGHSEDTLRLEAALRSGLASRGARNVVYLDNGSAMVSGQLLRALALLGIRLVHSQPGRPQGRHVAAQAKTGQSGVAAIGVAQEYQSVFGSTERQGSNGLPCFRFVKADRRVTCFYFYLWDVEFGPAFIKVCAYFPYPVKVWLKGPRVGQSSGHPRRDRVHRTVQRVRRLRRPPPPSRASATGSGRAPSRSSSNAGRVGSRCR